MPELKSFTTKTSWIVLLSLCLIKLAIHLYANGNYGFHRDELLHLATADHLAWGYMEFPPLIAFLAKLQGLLLGDSVLATRCFPALAGVAILFLTGLMAREMKGKTLAIFIGGACILAAHSYYRNHTLFQPVAFDQLLWTLSFYFLLRYINTQKAKYIYWFAVAAGLGFLNKYSILFLLAGLFIGIMLTSNRKWLTQKNWYMAMGLGLLIILPNLIWQALHDFPVFDHFAELYNAQLNASTRLGFLRGQFFSMNPFSFPIWMGGLIFFLFVPYARPYRLFGFAFLATLGLFLLTNGKHYYFFGIYPVLFAGGSVWIEQKLTGNWRWLAIAYTGWMLYTGFIRIPYGTPFLPIEQFAKYAGLEKNADGQLQGLTGDYADMFGWPEQVALVDSVYKSLSPEEQARCLIWAENYGEAGAIQHLGKRYGLPAPVSKHGSFWLWGPGENPGDIVISIGNETDDVNYFFEEVRLIQRITHPYAIEEEQHIPLYLCRQPKIRLKEYWPQWRDHVFD